ncbi:unnamed protein product [Zymoseptoria tritici ST99CH_1E4]|uniref:Exonuclease domain-containing protein n=1 Tax=Zymoseptoria tritici ST99CH_1E4 TaxID=1276532 RepID=A0A2H1FLC9_ZYMTR|nr:unnamed protein product [Zymoseptoria tritici ST99CH_1E4]
MVWTTTNLFKGIDCPAGIKCTLTSCIYTHHTPAEPASNQHASPANLAKPSNTSHDAAEPATKRRKITYETLAEKPPSRADLIRNQLAAVKSAVKPADKQGVQSAVTPPVTLTKPISPPQANAKPTKLAATPTKAANSTSAMPIAATKAPANNVKPAVEETLNPRLIANDPAGHQKRLVFLKALHVEMVRLNTKVRETVTADMAPTVVLTEQFMIKLALDEEEKCAREQPSVYSNVIKQRISGLRKMTIDDWMIYVKTLHAKPEPLPAKKQNPKAIVTGLEPDQEPLILPHLLADQKTLAAYGYVPVPPSPEEAAQCAAAVEASGNYETCERCAARFRMFPDRNADGALTSGGSCRYHPNRLVTPPSSKGDRELAPKEKFFPCCNEKAGYPGCTTSEDHVFKTTSAGRLAAILPFINTPDNPAPAKDKHGRTPPAVTFDCEMGYTTYGLELIRLTAVSWPSGEQLLDILVRPLGAIIDLNSRFSGVFPEHFQNAIPYEEWKESPPSNSDPTILPIVDHPRRARELLCSFLTPTTPLMGHAIDNDLNTVRLCHPTIVDTIVCFPHPRGLPFRFGLRMLTQRHLGRSIQTGGDRGHDSLEDARATGDLVRVKVGQKWKMMQSAGWTLSNSQLVPPVKKQEKTYDERLEDVVREENEATGETATSGAGQKRKKEVMAESESEGGRGHESRSEAVNPKKVGFLGY